MSAMTAIALPKESDLIQEISVATIKPLKANPRRSRRPPASRWAQRDTMQVAYTSL